MQEKRKETKCKKQFSLKSMRINWSYVIILWNKLQDFNPEIWIDISKLCVPSQHRICLDGAFNLTIGTVEKQQQQF